MLDEAQHCVVCDRILQFRGLIVDNVDPNVIKTSIIFIDDNEDGVPLVCVPIDNWGEQLCYVALLNDANAMRNYNIAVRAARTPKLPAKGTHEQGQ